MKLTKLLALVLCLVMVVSSFAACGGNNTDTQSQNEGPLTDEQAKEHNDQFLDEKGEIVNIGSADSMKITPEEIGNLKNKVVTGLEAWMTDDRMKEHVDWKKDVYGLVYDFDTVDGEQRMAKWISSYVAGDAYDVLYVLSGDFPLAAQNGLLQPLEKIMPVHDEEYFFQNVTDYFTWKNRVYAVNGWMGVDPYGIIYNESLFDNSGETTPMEHYENGSWTFDTFFNTMKAMDNVTGSANDVYGLVGTYSTLAQAAVVSNGGQILKYTDIGADLTLKDPKTMEALEWVNKVRNVMPTAYQNAKTDMQGGKAAMYINRQDQINGIRRSSPNYTFKWVPFPKGPSGEGQGTGSVYGWAIGKGAKNIEGAMAWIAADVYREEYFAANPLHVESETRTEEEFALFHKLEKEGRMDGVTGFGIGLWALLEDAKNTGLAAAIEKHTPSLQAEIDKVLEVEAQVGDIDFEDQGTFNFENQDDYPFVNVVGDDKVAYGTADNPSLKIDLTGVAEVSALVHTKTELFKLQNGGQYKVTFKLLCDKDPGAESFAVVARTTSALNADPSFGITWLTPKAGEVLEVEAYINVNSNFSGDLAVAILGSASGENTSVLIDDFRVSLVEGE